MHILIQRTSRSHTDQFLHTVVDNQLTRIDGDGWHSHSSTHDRYTVTFISTRVTKHVTDFVEANSVFKEILSNKFRTKRIPRKKNFISNFTLLSSNMDRHN